MRGGGRDIPWSFLLRVFVTVVGCSVVFGADSRRGEKAGYRKVEEFGSNPGNLSMYLYVPGNRPNGRRPVVLALHGCYGSAAQFRGTGWEAAAWKGKFYIIFGEQQQENSEGLCFNQFTDNAPEKGEAEIQSLLQMISYTRRNFAVDPARIYVTGFSSGGQMAGVLAARYPELFAGAALMGSGGFRCAVGQPDIPGFASCVDGEVILPESKPAAKSEARPEAKAASPKKLRQPRVTFWHGLQDRNVEPTSVTEGVRQWTHFHGIDQPGRTREIGRGIERTRYVDRGGQLLLETVIFQEMAHTIPVRPPHCGREVDRYFSAEPLCFAWESARFFGLIR